MKANAGEFDVVVVAQVKHGLLWELVQHFGNQMRLAEWWDVDPNSLSRWLNLRGLPEPARLRLNPKWQERENKLMTQFGIDLDDLFPAEVRNASTGGYRWKHVVKASVPLMQLGAISSRLQLPPTQDGEIEAMELSEAMKNAVSLLRPRLRRILTRRFGLDGDGEHTLDEVALEEGVTRTRIQQIEMQALRQLRHPSRARGLKPFLTEGEDGC